MGKPEFIDNREGNTLADALGEALAGPGDVPPELRIATGFFSPAGFARIADHVRAIPDVRLMLGVDLGATPDHDRRRLGESEDQYERRRLQHGLQRADHAIGVERDRLPFTRASRAALRKLIEGLRAGNMEVRRYDKDFLHAKAFILGSDGVEGVQPQGIIVGSSNVTAAGLTTNLELNVGRYDAAIVEQAQRWYDELWEDAEPYELATFFERALRPRTPWEIFLRVLWRLYGDEVEEDAREDQNLPLTSFQKHGVARALRLIRDTGGALVADEVGLGKTFIAGEILQVYADRRQRAVIVCPAALRDNVWKKFLTRYQLPSIECLSFEELARDIQLRDAQRPDASDDKLQRPLEEYQLVVVDEAHNYRNPDAPTRAAALRRLLYGQRRDVLLLTATPVNNSLWDLYHLVRFFVRQDAHFADRGILSIRALFERAMREDPSSLSPDLLFPIIDATTVKRTRQFVKSHYGRDSITGPDGLPIQIVFPKPEAITVRYEVDDRLSEFFDLVEEALDPNRAGTLTFTRYRPQAYLRVPDDADDTLRAEAMIGLLRSGLLKRFESSAYAFQRTASKMAHEHDVFLDALEAGYVVTTEFMKELSADDDAVFEDILEGTPHRADAALYDVTALATAVENDRDRLRELAAAAAKIVAQADPKLRALVEELIEIAGEASREAVHAIDEGEKRKVLVFSFFEDTVRWIRDFLEHELQSGDGLAGYRRRMIAVSGSGDLAEVSREQAVMGFAPVSMEAPLGRDADLYDLLVTTDVLAEGVNLQQCRNVINFDMPWNPMRLVQRHGRIDRIGSPHDRVFLRTFFPADRLDRLLDLEERILDKLAMAAASVGVVAPIEGVEDSTQVFTETREEIERLLNEDASLYERGGTAGAAQTGEEYRQTLRKALAQDRDGIVSLPWKVGSGMVKGARRGVFFCASVGARTYLRFVAADAEWGVEDADRGVVRAQGTCLRLIECVPETPTHLPEELRERVYDFWEVAQTDILRDWMIETDPANLQPKVRPLNLRVAEFIRANQPAGIPRQRLERALDVLESPWPRREEVMLRTWFDSRKDEGAPSTFLIEKILETGLEPVTPPTPLPPITKEDVELVCWMGVEAQSAAEAPT